MLQSIAPSLPDRPTDTADSALVQAVLAPLLAGELDKGWQEFFAGFGVCEDKLALCASLGRQLYTARKFELAREFFRRCHSLDRDDPEHARCLARCYAAEGDEEQAREWLRQASQRTARPSEPEAKVTDNGAAASVPGVNEVVHGLNELATACRETFSGLIQRLDELERQQRNVEIIESERRAHQAVRGERKLRAVFLAQTPESWVLWEHVYKSLLSDARFDARVVVVPYIRVGYEEKETLGSYLIGRGVAYVDHRYYDLERERPDVVFYMNPYEHQRPPRFRVDVVQRICRRIVYAPYGMELSGGAEQMHLNYDIPMIHQAWRILARSERHKAMFGRYCPRGNDHVLVSGHPKLDALRSFRREDVSPVIQRFAAGRKLILYNPHFSIDRPGGGFCTFLRWKDPLFDMVESRADCALILRPHPLLFGMLVHSKRMTLAQVEALKHRVAASGSLLLDLAGDYLHAMHAADAIVSDASSLLLEFAVLGKPVAYLHNPAGPGLNDDAGIAEHFYRPQSDEDLRAFVDMVVASEDPLGPARMKALETYVYKPEGSVAEIVKEHIWQAIRDGL